MTDTTNYDYHQDPTLSNKWKSRFDFYEKNGLPGFWVATPAWKEAFKKMGFKERILIGMNLFAYFFNVIYLLILGLWKKAILVLIMNVAIGFIMAILDVNYLGFAINILTAMRANIWYYQYKVHNIHDWSV